MDTSIYNQCTIPRFLTDFSLGAGSDLPTYIKANRYLRNMLINRRKNHPHQDNLCFFRCLKFHFNNQKKSKRLSEDMVGI